MAQSRVEGPTLVLSDAITQADTGTTVNAIEIPAGSFIPPYGVSIVVVEAFAGGTPSLDVGDEDDPDGWIDSVDITEVTPATYSGTETNTVNDAVNGKYYAAAGKIQVVVSASLTDGTAYVVAGYYNLPNSDLSAQ